MAEETLHDSFSGATKGLFGTIGFLLLMFGGEVMLDRAEPRFILGAMLCLAGVMCFYMAFAGKVIRNRLSNYTIQEINSIARSPKWWFAALLAFVVSISLWHYAGPSFTKPEIIFADAVTKGWSYHDGMFEIDVRGGPLLQFKDDYRLVLYVKPPIVGADRMEDTHGTKSKGYTIYGGIINLIVPINKDLCSFFNTANGPVELIVVLLPKKFAPEQITSLSSVEAMGGKIAADLDGRTAIRQNAIISNDYEEGML